MAVLFPAIGFLPDILDCVGEDVPARQRTRLRIPAAEKFGFGVNVILPKCFGIGSEPRPWHRLPRWFAVEGVISRFRNVAVVWCNRFWCRCTAVPHSGVWVLFVKALFGPLGVKPSQKPKRP